jgi:hypothetical protein
MHTDPKDREKNEHKDSLTRFEESLNKALEDSIDDTVEKKEDDE